MISCLWRERLDRWPATRVLWLGYSAFVAGYFVFPQAPDHYHLYYLAVLLPMLWLLRSAHRALAGAPLYWLIVSYIIYMSASALWSRPFNGAGVINTSWHGLLVLSFVLATGWLARTDQARLWTLLEATSVLAAVVGALSALVFYQHHAFPASRLEPISRVDNPVLAGCTYGLFSLVAMNTALRPRGQCHGIFYGGVTLVLLVTVLLTQSRTALIALAISAVILAGLRSRWLLAVGTALLGLFVLTPGLWQLIDRGIPYRPEIWATVIRHMDGHWLLGYGALTPTTVTVGHLSFPHAHSAYLAALRDGGVPGLALLSAMLAIALACAVYRYREQPLYLALLIFACLCAAPDNDRLLSRPKEYWLFFWLPVILLLALSGRQDRLHLATRSGTL